MANHPIPTYSRYVKRSFAWPGADHADGLSSIIDLAKQHGLHGWVLIATGDQDMRMIAQNHALLSQYFRVATPDWDTIQWAYDKRLTYQPRGRTRHRFPGQLSCRAAWTRSSGSIAAFRSFSSRPSARAWTSSRKPRPGRRTTATQLLALYQRAAALVGNDAIIVQEWIPGTGEAQFSYAGLWERGEPVVSLVARRRRQHPIDFGRSSTYVETIEQSEVEELACRFLKSLNYTGVVEVEFKHDRRDGQYKLLDVNGRFWTWNGLGALAGVDFPYLAWRQALGETVSPARARPGVAWMHASRDVIAAYRGNIERHAEPARLSGEFQQAAGLCEFCARRSDAGDRRTAGGGLEPFRARCRSKLATEDRAQIRHGARRPRNSAGVTPAPLPPAGRTPRTPAACVRDYRSRRRARRG